MNAAHTFSLDDLPDSPHARQLREGFPWLRFDAVLENDFRRTHFDANIGHTRFNLCLAMLITVAFAAMDALVLGPQLNRVPSLIHMLLMLPALLLGFATTLGERRHRNYPPVAIVGGALVGLGAAAIQLIATFGGVSELFPCVLLAVTFIYFMCGLFFYHAVTANLVILFAYLAAGMVLEMPGHEFGYDALALLAANLFGASTVYTHEKTARMRFLEACLLKEMVARDGLTGIQNRRMFDQHMHRVWQQALREQQQVAVLLIDIDCFKDYNDRYGHQAGDECLRAVAVSLSHSARRPLDFVARYGGEEFAIVLYQATREYVSEVVTRIQRSIAELNIPHEASRVASRLTVSIGAAYVLPAANRTLEGLVQLADEALYGAKEQGRNCVIVMEAEYHTLTTGRFKKRRAQR
jgi:diguanylate cyclase (GGDEF)-like protein